MKRMLQHHAANGWGDDTAQPANVPAPADDDQLATAGSGVLVVLQGAAVAGCGQYWPPEKPHCLYAIIYQNKPHVCMRINIICAFVTGREQYQRPSTTSTVPRCKLLRKCFAT